MEKKANNIQNEFNIFKNAIDVYGIEPQFNMVFEECGELINALAKFIRGRNQKNDVITELADVSIMIGQMAYFFGYDDFMKEKEFKLERLEKKLNEQENKVKKIKENEYNKN